MKMIYMLNGESLSTLSDVCLKRIPTVKSQREKSKLSRTAYGLSKLSNKKAAKAA